MADLTGTITTGVELSGTLSVAELSSGSIVTGNSIAGQILGGPKGETGDTGPPGDSGIYVSSEPPLDPEVGDLWLDIS